VPPIKQHVEEFALLGISLRPSFQDPRSEGFALGQLVREERFPAPEAASCTDSISKRERPRHLDPLAIRTATLHASRRSHLGVRSWSQLSWLGPLGGRG